jgi:acetyl esterase/lipase
MILPLLVAAAASMSAVSASPAQDVIRLWDGDAPYSKPNSLQEYVAESWGVLCVNNVTVPTLTVHPARGESSGRAIVILPGGGYERESFIAEGSEIAKHLAGRGITAAVLKYRIPLPEASDTPELLPTTDARRAVSLLRSMAATYGFDPTKVGVLGFSAGGHLAATVSVTPTDAESERPDYSVLVYAVTTIAPENREWLEATLFHRAMTPDEVDQYSLVDRVSQSTPPAFLTHAFDDDVVPISESQAYAAALAAAGRDLETHFFARGGHGFGPGRAADGTAQWLDLAADWINRQ